MECPSPSAASCRSTAERSSAHPTATTESSAPSVWNPDPKVRSQGVNTRMFTIGGSAKMNTTAAVRVTARGRSRRVLSVTPATSTSSAATSER